MPKELLDRIYELIPVVVGALLALLASLLTNWQAHKQAFRSAREQRQFEVGQQALQEIRRAVEAASTLTSAHRQLKDEEIEYAMTTVVSCMYQAGVLSGLGLKRYEVAVVMAALWDVTKALRGEGNLAEARDKLMNAISALEQQILNTWTATFVEKKPR